MRLWQLVVVETRTRAGFLPAAVVATAIVLTAIAVRFSAQDYRYRIRESAQLAEQRQTDRSKNLWLLGWSLQPELRAVRTPSPLSVFVRGLDGAMPSFWDFSPWGSLEGPPERSVAQGSEAGSLLDLESVVRLVLGLLSVIVALDAVAGARASGTLQGVLMQPIGARLVATGKILSGVISLSTALAVTLAVAAATAWLTAGDLLTSGFVGFLGAFGLSSLAYLLTVYLVCAIIGSVTREYGRATGLTLAAWIYIAFIAPQVTIVGARTVWPVPPAQVIEADRKAVYDQRDQGTRQTLGELFIALTGPMPTRAAALTASPEVMAEMERSWSAETAETRAMLQAIEQRSAQPVEAQERAMTWLTWTNPGTLFLEVATDLANTGRAAESRWRRDIRGYQDFLNARVFDDRPKLTLVSADHLGRRTDTYYRKMVAPVAGFPEFVPSPAGLGTRLRECGGNLAVMTAYLVALVAGALLLFPKSS